MVASTRTHRGTTHAADAWACLVQTADLVLRDSLKLMPFSSSVELRGRRRELRGGAGAVCLPLAMACWLASSRLSPWATWPSFSSRQVAG
eukprot:483859-Prymnesium_polylepis.1